MFFFRVERGRETVDRTVVPLGLPRLFVTGLETTMSLFVEYTILYNTRSDDVDANADDDGNVAVDADVLMQIQRLLLLLVPFERLMQC